MMQIYHRVNLLVILFKKILFYEFEKSDML